MMLDDAQIGFFRAFGYLVIRGLLTDSVDWISDEFDRVMRDHVRQYPHDEKRRTLKWQFIDSSERLCMLLDDPRIEGTLSSLLGDDFIYTGSSGNLYAGDTGWHTDDFYLHDRVKITVYLDPLTAETGALRVIPCSQHVDERTRILQLQLGQSVKLLGVRGDEVPAVAISVVPGDLVLFDQNILHSSWGGGSRRRMFSINAHRRYTDDKLHLLRSHVGLLSRFWCDRVHGELMRSTATQQRMKHLEQVFAHEGDLAELVREARTSMGAPSRDLLDDLSDNQDPHRTLDEYAHNAIFEPRNDL